MQVVPAVVDDVASLTVYQRSPQWVAPNPHYFARLDDGHRWLLAHYPYYAAWARLRLVWAFSDKIHASLQRDDTWPEKQLSINAVNDGHREYFSRYLHQALEGRPDLVDLALPRYPPFAKRMLLDNGWFAALRRDHVELVAQPVVGLTSGGVVAADGTERPADVVVLATGFRALGLLQPMEVVGASGRRLRDVWGTDDATAYLGMTLPDLPNFFMLYGPNTNLGHGGSLMFMAECQVAYLTDLLRRLGGRGGRSARLRPEVLERHIAAVDDAHERMIWTHPATRSWYRNAAGRVVTNSPWRVVDYFAMTCEADLGEYEVDDGAVGTGAGTAAAGPTGATAATSATGDG